jgi:leader peptidase (prepilin peptidase)/N-methyltransferase
MALTALALVVGFAVGVQARGYAFRLTVPAGTGPRTGCDSCGRVLVPSRWLVPAWLRPDGRCPACRTRVGPPYGLVELTIAAAFGLLAWRYGPDPRLPALLVCAAIAIALGFVDVAVHRLPDRLVLPAYPVVGALVVAASLWLGDRPSLLRAVLGLLGYAGVLLLAALPPGGVGFGDVKLAGLLGAVLAWIDWSALVRGVVLALLLAGGCALVLLVARRVRRRSYLPLGPFLVAGGLLSLLGNAPATAG